MYVKPASEAMLAKQTYLKTVTVVSCGHQGLSTGFSISTNSGTDFDNLSTHVDSLSDGSVKHVLDPFHTSSAYSVLQCLVNDVQCATNSDYSS